VCVVFPSLQSKNQVHRRGEYNVYSTFQSHEPEFDYLKSLEIEEKINKIRWLPQQNAAYFLLSTNDKTVKLWKVSERDKRPEGYNLKDEEGRLRDPATITTLRVSPGGQLWPPSFASLGHRVPRKGSPVWPRAGCGSRLQLSRVSEGDEAETRSESLTAEGGAGRV